MKYHNDEYLDWIVNKNDIKLIKAFLMKSYKGFSQYTNKDSSQYINWQIACFLWNLEYNFVFDIDQYFKGEYDEKNKANPSYVPHDQKMPETWIYNPPKKKGN